MKTWREHIMNINWKVRLKSGPFWLGVASAVIMAVFYILDLCGAAPEITGSQIIEAVRLLLTIPGRHRHHLRPHHQGRKG